MVVQALNPTSDDGPNAWSIHAPGPGSFGMIDEGAVPDIEDAIGYLETNGDDNDEEVFGFGTIAVIEVTQVVVSVYGQINGAGASPECDVNLGGYIGVQEIGLTTIRGWHHITFAGLSGSQADLDGLQVKLIADASVAKTGATIYTMYVTITYTATGWGHKFLGVAGANIANVNGVPRANIGKIKGV